MFARIASVSARLTLGGTKVLAILGRLALGTWYLKTSCLFPAPLFGIISSRSAMCSDSGRAGELVAESQIIPLSPTVSPGHLIHLISLSVHVLGCRIMAGTPCRNVAGNQSARPICCVTQCVPNFPDRVFRAGSPLQGGYFQGCILQRSGVSSCDSTQQQSQRAQESPRSRVEILPRVATSQTIIPSQNVEAYRMITALQIGERAREITAAGLAAILTLRCNR
jgi:hypothetical protein